MGANSQQGVALAVFFVAFTLASAGMLYGGNLVLIGLGVVTFGASIAMFLKAKPLEG